MEKMNNNIPQGYTESPIGIIPKEWEAKHTINFSDLSVIIKHTHDTTQSTAIKAINRISTLRNWLIGYYIVEFEQNGKDHAVYGVKLLKRLEESVDTKGLNETLFKVSRAFYRNYPQIRELLSFEEGFINGAMTSHELQMPRNEMVKISTMPSHEFKTSALTLVSSLSFSHIRELLTVESPLARYFYETECIRCCWSVKELRRQISSDLFTRCGISKKPEELIATLQNKDYNIKNDVKQPFTFEFLGLFAKDIITEKDLEQSLIEHLQEFLLELGKGFCFEARQKRIIIDDEYYFADLVFYHRLLHCNVIIELKNDEFHHEYLGQLNAYVSYYKENEMHDGDNLPIGILLCTRKGKKMVEYAIAGMDNHLFVSTYLLQLPEKSTLENFLLTQMEIE